VHGFIPPGELSPKGHARHAARIKVAIDPPNTLDVTAITARVAVHDGALVAGQMLPALLQQVQRFIDLNRGLILRYWSQEIDTAVLVRRLKAAPPR
jgi:hypothetical protein